MLSLANQRQLATMLPRKDAVALRDIFSSFDTRLPQNPLDYSDNLATGVAMIQAATAGDTIATAEPVHIYVPAGLHVLSAPIEITRHNVTLTVDGGATLTPPSNQPAIMFDPTGTPEGYIKHWQIFLDGVIKGTASGSGQHGIVFNDCIHGSAVLNEIRDLGGSGLVFDGSCFSNHVTFNRIHGVAGWGINSTGANNHNAMVLLGEIQAATLGGANLWRWTDSDINLRIENMSGGVQGIKLDGVRGSRLSFYFENGSNNAGDDIVTAATTTRCDDLTIIAPSRFKNQKTGSAYNLNIAANTADRITIRDCGVFTATTRIVNIGAGNTKIKLASGTAVPMAGITNAAGVALEVEPVVLGQSAVQVTAPANTAFNSLATITVPAGALGANGMITVESVWGMTNNANAKLVGVRLNGSTGTVISQNSVANFSSTTLLGFLANRNSASVQVTGTPNAVGGVGSTGTAVNTASVNTASAFTIDLVGQKATGGDTITLDMYKVTMYPRP